MKLYFRFFGWLVALLVLCTSCMNSSDNTITTYSDAAITSFSVGTLNRTMHTTSSTGEDSVYTTTVDCSGYAFSIDQLKHEIFNVDSLPVGIDATRVLCTLATYNSGTAIVKGRTDDESDVYFSSSDSLDLSVKRIIRVYSSDGTAYNDYTVTLNVHQQDPDEFQWHNGGAYSEWASLTSVKCFFVDHDHLYVAGLDGNATKVFRWYKNAADEPAVEAVSQTFSADALNNMAATADGLLVLSDGVLYQVKGADDCTVVEGASLSRLLGALHYAVLGVSQDQQLVRWDTRETEWTADEGDAIEYLPTENVATLTYVKTSSSNQTTASEVEYVMLAGNRSATAYPDDRGTVVWGRTADISDLVNPYYGEWTYMAWDSNNYLYLPKIDHLSLVAYDNKVLAFGLKGGENVVYESSDGGIFWRTGSIELPADVASGQPIAASSLLNGILVLVEEGTGRLWTGYENQLANSFVE